MSRQPRPVVPRHQGPPIQIDSIHQRITEWMAELQVPFPRAAGANYDQHQAIEALKMAVFNIMNLSAELQGMPEWQQLKQMITLGNPNTSSFFYQHFTQRLQDLLNANQVLEQAARGLAPTFSRGDQTANRCIVFALAGRDIVRHLINVLQQGQTPQYQIYQWNLPPPPRGPSQPGPSSGSYSYF